MDLFQNSVFTVPRIPLKILPFAPSATWGVQGWFLGAARRKVGSKKRNGFLGLKKSIFLKKIIK